MRLRLRYRPLLDWVLAPVLGIALGLGAITVQPVPRTIVAHSDTLPATCIATNGEIYFKTGAASGLYQCLATNTWSAVSGADVQTLLDGISTVQGAVLYRNLNDWVVLAPGTLGQFLQTQGPGANPQWSTPAGSGDVSSNTATSVVDEVALFADASGKLIKRSTGSGRPLLTSGVLSLANINLTSEVTGDLPLSNLAQASAASRLLGRGSAGGAGDYEEITIGSGLTLTGTVLTGGVTFTPKTADEPITSSTYQDDDALFFAIGSNQTYIAEFTILYTAATADDIKLAFSGPASATTSWCPFGLETSVTTFFGNLSAACQTVLTDVGATMGGAGASTIITMKIFGTFTTAGTSGTITLRWARNAGSGTVTIKAGSSLWRTCVSGC